TEKSEPRKAPAEVTGASVLSRHPGPGRRDDYNLITMHGDHVDGHDVLAPTPWGKAEGSLELTPLSLRSFASQRFLQVTGPFRVNFLSARAAKKLVLAVASSGSRELFWNPATL